MNYDGAEWKANVKEKAWGQTCSLVRLMTPPCFLFSPWLQVCDLYAGFCIWRPHPVPALPAHLPRTLHWWLADAIIHLSLLHGACWCCSLVLLWDQLRWLWCPVLLSASRSGLCGRLVGLGCGTLVHLRTSGRHQRILWQRPLVPDPKDNTEPFWFGYLCWRLTWLGAIFEHSYLDLVGKRKEEMTKLGLFFHSLQKWIV